MGWELEGGVNALFYYLVLLIKEGWLGREFFSLEVNFRPTSTGTLPRLIKRGRTAHSWVQYANINL